MAGGHKFYWSWREKAPEIICELRTQLPGSCAHFSTGNAIEMRTKLKWMREGNLKEDVRAAKISIQKIVDGCPPVCSLERVLNFVYNQPILSTNDEQVFWMSDYIALKPLEKKGDMAEMIRHLILDGPIVGSFPVDCGFKPRDEKINLCQGIGKSSPFGKPLRHCVAIVGFGVDEDYNLFWEYMETDNPLEETYDRDGFGRITLFGFNKVFVPLVG